MRGLLFAAALRLWAPGESQATAEEARQAFEAGDYDRVVELSRQAYEETGEISFLYAQAHAERFRGNCEAALALYGRVLAANPTGEYAGFAQQGVRLCEEELATEPTTSEPEPEPQPEILPPPPQRVTEAASNQDPDADTNAQRPSPDVLGATLLSTGAVATAAGATLLVSGDFARRRANAAADEATHIEHRERSSRLVISGAVVGGVGVALLVGASIRYLTLRRSRASAAVVPYERGVAVVGRF